MCLTILSLVLGYVLLSNLAGCGSPGTEHASSPDGNPAKKDLPDIVFSYKATAVDIRNGWTVVQDTVAG